jgi:hypothetical protein
MRYVLLLALAMLAVPTGANAQSATETIEGYWQDIAGRGTFKRNPLPADRYGDWYDRPLDATYPLAKHIRKAGSSFDLVELNYDESDYSVRVVSASDRQIDFVRQAKWSPCRAQQSCRLTGSELFCVTEHVCVEDGKEVVDLITEERFVRRSKCARTQTRPEAQGFPVACN